jgi:hypothetical protein
LEAIEWEELMDLVVGVNSFVEELIGVCDVHIVD